MTYPDITKEMVAEGLVIVAFIVNPAANISDVHIQESNSKLLNNCSIETIKWKVAYGN